METECKDCQGVCRICFYCRQYFCPKCTSWSWITDNYLISSDECADVEDPENEQGNEISCTKCTPTIADRCFSDKELLELAIAEYGIKRNDLVARMREKITEDYTVQLDALTNLWFLRQTLNLQQISYNPPTISKVARTAKTMRLPSLTSLLSPCSSYFYEESLFISISHHS
eukprot:TRINITY_DN4490_c0_g1_i1.p1 TRINITY_DN4490_c0_g1~~TRINITY_DN4490_c0_g1_i1.p1  ORF type:complete len:172 (-),score=14.81 TRINITY_DN4490_c0_g1_i1:91-606(-)